MQIIQCVQQTEKVTGKAPSDVFDADRRPCRDSRHVTAPYKLALYYVICLLYAGDAWWFRSSVTNLQIYNNCLRDGD